MINFTTLSLNNKQSEAMSAKNNSYEEDLSPYIDLNGEFDGWHRHLPHLHQECKVQFFTFRLEDSLPQNILAELRKKKEEFERQHLSPWDEATTNEFHKIINKKKERWLEQGYGECVLRRPDVRKILIDAITYIDETKCLILGYVIMPNHVHLLMWPLPGFDSIKTIGTIKQYSARRINKMLGRRGRLWNDEFFERMIRNEKHLRYCLDYIQKNPRNIPEGEYALYFNYDLIKTILKL